MPPDPKKTREKEDYGATGKTRRKPTVRKGTPMPDGERNPALHDIEGDPENRARRVDIEKGGG